MKILPKEWKIKSTKIISMCVIAAMLVSGVILLTPDTVGSENNTEYYYVVFEDNLQPNVLKASSNVEIIKSDAIGALIRTTEGNRNELANSFSINEVTDRTKVRLMEAGIEFDSISGYEVPAEWSAGNSNQYIVQFIAPMTGEWLESLKMNSLSFFDTVGNNLAIVKLSQGQKAQVEKLPFVEWVGTYEPLYKVYANARERTGEFNVRISPFGVSVWQLAQELSGMGFRLINIDDGCNLVDITVSENSLPLVAKLETVGLIQYFPEQVQQASMSGEIVGAHAVWDQTRSNLPVPIMGEGQVYQHQDFDMTPGLQDFAAGPLGDRIIFCESSGDSSGHATNCVGIAAGNGYLMETFLGLSTSNRNYNEIAATNPYGFLDRTGFAGRAPETGIVSYDGLVTSELDDGYTTYNARVFSLSYGPVSITNGYANAVDSFMLSYPNGLAFISACNYGPNLMTVSGNGNGKNAVSVGAAENNRGDWFQSDDNPWGLWTGSCKGPVSASDLRVKPDIVEIGAGVIMTKSPNSAAGDNDLYKGSNNLASLKVDANSDGDADYNKNQGTSFSCPAAAGDTILIRDFLVDVKGYDNNPSEGTNEPDAMLLKAYLINGAKDMGYGYPSYGQGWGMASPEYSIAPPAPLSVKDWSGTGNSGPITLEISSPSAPLKISMAHWDTGTSSGALTVDYDLVLTAPDGSTKYYGNAFAESESVPLATANNWAACRFPTWSAFPSMYPTGYYDWDTDNDGGDDINNVEVILINQPQKGTWTLEIVHRAGTAAKWSVVSYADFGPQLNYQVGMKQDAPVNYHMRDGYGTQSHMVKAGGTVSVGFTVHNFGLNTDTISLAASYQGDGAVPGDPLPSGWSVSYDTGATLNLNSDERAHVLARVTVPAAATEGAYPIRVKATSGNSVSNYYIVFNIDVVNQRLPNRVQVTDSKLPNMNPGIGVYSNYVVVSYLQDTGIGERVFVSISSDSGATFGAPIPVTTQADDPQCIEMRIAPAGHNNAGRAFIVYNSMEPLVNGDDWNAISHRRIVCARADPPYTSWTVNFPLNNGAGPAAFNDYREMDIGFFSPNQVIIVENNYYNNRDDMNNAWTKFTPYALFSTDGGATWGGGTDVTMGSSNQFGQTVSNRANGNLVLANYMIGSPARRMMYREYNGATWSTPVVALTFSGIDAMWGSVGGDPTNDRAYVVAGQSNSANYNDFKLPYVSYTDNGGTSFSTPAGVLGGANNRCDNGHFDSNKMMDMDVTTDGVAWASVKQHPTSTINRFWSYNLYSASSTYASGYAAHTNNQLTRDSYAKEPSVRATAQGNNLLVAYSAFENGPADIFMLKVYNGWQTDTADSMGPKAELHAPDTWIQNRPLKISAIFDEFNSGYNNIQAAQYRWNGGTAVAMSASDGAFNNVVESAEATDIMSIAIGDQYLEVRAQDSAGNWGLWVGKNVFIYSVIIPDEPMFAGLERVVNPGTGTSLRLEWTAGSDPNGNEYPLTYHIYRSTTPGFTPGTAIDTSKTSGIGDIGTPMTWSDNSVTTGTTYYYIVRAIDSGTPAEMEMNTVEKSGTPESLVYFQVQSPAAGFRNLNTDSFEVAVQTGTSAVMTVAGEYQIDATSGKWRSASLAYNTDLSGTWRFYINGKMNNDHANGFLYAKVYKNSDSSLLFSTGYDDEDIAGFTSYHQFVWSHTVTPGTLNLASGDSYYVELWLHVTAVTAPGGGAENIYDFSSGAGTNRWYYDCSWATNPPSGITPSRQVELPSVTGGAYSQIAVLDTTLSASVDAGTGLYAGYKIVTNLAEGPSEVSSVSMTYTAGTAGTDAGYVTRIYVWNHASSTWLFISEAQLPRVTATGTVSGTLSSATTGFTQWSDYVNAANSNQFLWLVFHTIVDAGNRQTRLQCDYVKTTVTGVATPDGVFTFGYDSDATASAVHPELPVGGGPSPEAYNIDLTGHVAGDWVFVSFPIAISGNIETILNDPDGTEWDVAKWWDGATQSWKTHRIGGTQTFTTINNQMGVWVHLTAVTNNRLRTGTTGYYPGTTQIQLYSGWNMVGYPSATNRAADVVLTGTNTDTVSTYLSTSPYVQDFTTLSAVTMSEGNAYWVHVPANTLWTVNP